MAASAADDVVLDGLPNPRRAWAFLVLSIAMGMAVIDGSIVNIALPTISGDLNIAKADAIWIVNAYQLAVAVSLLPLASLGDSLGYKRVYSSGLALFTVASLFCALAPNLPVLVVARVVQGLGAAGMMCVNVAIIRFIYPSSMLGRGVGAMAVVVATTSALSPSVGAAILSVASWHWLFLVNVPIGLGAWLLSLRALPKTPRTGHPIDLVSVGLNVAMIGLLVTGIDRLGEAQELGFALAQLAGAGVVCGLLIWRQIGRAAPILPIDLLSTRIFALSLATSIASFGAQALALVALPFLFIGELHLSATATGLLLTPWPLTVALIAPVSGRLADRFSPGPLGSLGLVVMGAGLLLLAFMPAHPAPLDVAWRLAVSGLGFGFFQSPNNRLIVGSAPPHRSGAAAGLQSTGRLVGQSVGTAILAVIFGRGLTAPTQTALLVAAAMTLVAAIASGLRKKR